MTNNERHQREGKGGGTRKEKGHREQDEEGLKLPNNYLLKTLLTVQAILLLPSWYNITIKIRRYP